MTQVIDASVAAAWAFEDEISPRANVALERLKQNRTIVPWIWWYEVRNILIVSERRGRVSGTEVDKFRLAIARLPIELDQAPDEAGIFRLARKHRLTFYDAAYLELAVRQRASIATFDQELERAAHAEDVSSFDARD